MNNNHLLFIVHCSATSNNPSFSGELVSIFLSFLDFIHCRTTTRISLKQLLLLTVFFPEIIMLSRKSHLFSSLKIDMSSIYSVVSIHNDEFFIFFYFMIHVDDVIFWVLGIRVSDWSIDPILVRLDTDLINHSVLDYNHTWHFRSSCGSKCYLDCVSGT